MLLLGIPALGSAQDSEGGPSRAWWSLWSEPADQNRVVVYMTSVHIDSDREGWSNDLALGLVYKSLYGATFRTTHGPRGWSFGVERSWISIESGPAGAMLGFRGGLVYGYDEELGWLAGDIPVLPFFQPILFGYMGPIGVDVGYSWVVMSVTAAVRF